ncbi:hypothetical protein Efla_001058 [Eimeria flavescens]
MLSCCCGEPQSPRSEALTEVQPSEQEALLAGSKSAAAAPTAAPAAPATGAAAPAAAEEASSSARATADGPDRDALAAMEAAAAATTTGAGAAETRAAEANAAAPPAAAKKVVISVAKKESAPVKKPLTAPTVQRARRTSVPLESPIEEGVFLMFDSETQCIYALWSKSPQPKALAWLKPLVAVPEHKFKVNGGKQVFFTNASEGGKYYQGWVKFISLANEYPSKLMLLDNFGAAEAEDVQLLQLVEGPTPGDESTCVAEALTEYNKLIDLKNVKAIAVLPLSSSLIQTGKSVTPQKFLQMGRGEGDAAPIQIKRV